MTLLITVFVAAIVLLLLPYSLAETVTIWRALRRERPPGPDVEDEASPSLLFLVLAHDEELLISDCLASLIEQDYPEERRTIVLVADNCTDDTAELGKASGVEVLERFDDHRRGKPWAIAWALDRLELAAFEGVVIIDADTRVARDFATELARRSPLSGKVLQPFIGVQNPDDSPLTRMAAVYERAVHGLAYRMKHKAGVNVPLGVGMCIGTDVLEGLGGWPAFSIAEDVELYVILTLAGVTITPVPEARITAQEAASLQQSSGQRHRWTSGRLDVLRRYWRPVASASRLSWHQRLDTMAELLSPGPVVHLGVSVVLLTAILFLDPFGAELLITLTILSLARPVGYSIWALSKEPHPGSAIKAFLYLPVYLVWRLARAFVTLIIPGRGRWERAERLS